MAKAKKKAKKAKKKKTAAKKSAKRYVKKSAKKAKKGQEVGTEEISQEGCEEGSQESGAQEGRAEEGGCSEARAGSCAGPSARAGSRAELGDAEPGPVLGTLVRRRRTTTSRTRFRQLRGPRLKPAVALFIGWRSPVAVMRALWKTDSPEPFDARGFRLLAGIWTVASGKIVVGMQHTPTTFRGMPQTPKKSADA